MVLHAPVCICLIMYGHVMSHMAPFDVLWPCLFPYGNYVCLCSTHATSAQILCLFNPHFLTLHNIHMHGQSQEKAKYWWCFAAPKYRMFKKMPDTFWPILLFFFFLCFSCLFVFTCTFYIGYCTEQLFFCKVSVYLWEKLFVQHCLKHPVQMGMQGEYKYKPSARTLLAPPPGQRPG